MPENENRFEEEPEITELQKIESEAARIEQELKQHISAEQAAEITRKFFEAAFGINEINRQILADPLVIKNYIRDGNKLRKRSNPEAFSTLPDASFLLKAYVTADYPDNTAAFLKWLDFQKELAEDRLIKLRSEGDIAIVSRDMVKETVEFREELKKNEIEKYFDQLMKEEKDENDDDKSRS
ncbi:MAG: hypothetical protein WDN47_01365 [Candidatus Doudnabacteria bacterium]